MRIELDILVPLHLVAALEPFEVQLGMVEHDIRAQQVCRHIGQHVLHEGPIGRVLLVRALDAAHAGGVRAVFGGEVEDVPRFPLRTTLVHHAPGDRQQALDPSFRHGILHERETLLEIVDARLLRQDARRFGQNEFGRHGAGLRYSVSPTLAAAGPAPQAQRAA